MAKVLKPFKKKIKPAAIEPEVLEAEESESTLPEITTNNNQTLGVQSLKLLEQLEKAGYTAIASKLRELQVSEGLAAIDPMVERLKAIEARVDELLTLGCPIETEELQRLLNITEQAYQARAKALLLPFGTVSPRTALQSNRAASGPVSVNIGIGTGVTPKPKSAA